MDRLPQQPERWRRPDCCRALSSSLDERRVLHRDPRTEVWARPRTDRLADPRADGWPAAHGSSDHRRTRGGWALVVASAWHTATVRAARALFGTEDSRPV